MERRAFIRLGFLGLGSSVFAPHIALARVSEQQMAGGVYYTREAPGRWNKKVTSHLPNIEVEKTEGKVILRVLTRHTMDDYEHYIVKHMILDKEFRFLEEKMFNPLQDKEPLSEFALGQYSGPIYALSVCNQHDTWLNTAEI